MSKNINVNINVQNITKNFLFKTHKTKHFNKKKITKIRIYNFLSKNEAFICEKIKQIPYYFNYFNIIIDYDNVNIGQLNEKVIEKLDVNNKYILFQYKDETGVQIGDYLLDINCSKLFTLQLIESYEYIINSLIKINDISICVFNLSTENIIFNIEHGEKPIIQNFEKSIYNPYLSEKYITKIINETEDYTYKPLEVHLLFYLIKNDLNTVSYSLIEDICDNYIKSTDFTSLFSIFNDKNYAEYFKNECANSLIKYINKPKSYIISDIITNSINTWDVYSVSLIYLRIILNCSFTNAFIKDLINKLIKNIEPNYLKRKNNN